MDPTTLFPALLAFLATIPHVASYIPLACFLAAITVTLVKPPALTSKFYPVYALVNLLALNVRHAVNANDVSLPGKIMAAIEAASRKAAEVAPKVAAVLLLCFGLGLSGCASFPSTANVVAATTATVSQAQQDVQTAINLYGVAKGLAGVAEPALALSGQPEAAAAIASAVAAVDPIVQQAQTALNDATTDANALEDLAKQIEAQANALTLKAAPSIAAVPSATS